MFVVKSKGDFSNTYKFLKRAQARDFLKNMYKYGERGVSALSAATPVSTGKTAASWSYEISQSNNTVTISWKNSNVVNGVPIAIILQYGHGTKNGGYVQGRDYINPTIQPIFDEILKSAWEEVKKL